MNLSEITTEQLMEELKRRESEGHDPEQFPFIGMVDDEGIDSIVEVDAEKFAKTLHPLQLRARFNSQRRPELFFVKLPRDMAKSLEKDRTKGAEVLKGLSNYQTINY